MAEQIKHALSLVKEAKISKKRSGYIELDDFKRTKDLDHGYFCYSCVYFINVQGERCAIVHNNGEDCLERVRRYCASRILLVMGAQPRDSKRKHS